MISKFCRRPACVALCFFIMAAIAFPLAAAEPVAAGRRYALLIGINDYADSSIVKLKTPRNDASDLGRSLSASGWDKVIVLTDDVDYRNPDFPNRTNIENRVALLADLVKSQDMIFVFFSGHGVTSGKNSLLLPVDAALSRVGDTSIPIDSIISTFSARGLKRVVVAVDACREQVSTTKGLSVVGLSGGVANSAANAAAITMYATKAGWYSYEDEGGRNGVFTKFILDGLSGRADGSLSGEDANGVVTFAELAAWLPDATATYALDRGIRQQAVIANGTGDRSVLDVPVANGSAAPKTARSANASATAAASAPPPSASSGNEIKPALDSLKAHINLVITDSIKEIDRSISSKNSNNGGDYDNDADYDYDYDYDNDNDRSSINSSVDGSADESEKYGFSFLQLGLFTPVQLCPARYTIGGIAVGAIQTYNKSIYGIQAAGIVASTGTMGGMQTAVICTSGQVYGIQCGALVNTASDVFGGQFGFINTASSVHGVQIGFINTAKDLRGVQLGFINTLAKGGLFGKFMFGLNIGW
jgi:hypothetical protein